jgi:archaemetzincin
VCRNDSEASSNGRTADFGSAYEGSNPSASATPGQKPGGARAELTALARPSQVLVVSLGEVGPKLVVEAGHALREILGIPAKAGPSLDRPRYAFNEARAQYHSTAIVRRLASLRGGASGPPVVGIADVDLFLPDAPYVIGDADRDAGAALFSLARLSHGEPEDLRRRAQVETVHATGHLLGLSHCGDYRCAMFVSRDAADSDRKGPGLCASCRAALGAEE